VADPTPELREISRRPSPLTRVTNVWAYRELLGNLVRKDLKVRYKDSVLGFAWTLLNPLLYLVIFSMVFAGLRLVSIPRFGIFLLSGLLAWNLFSNGLNGGAGSIVGNASLVQKVWFPREILPLASIGTAMVNFGLQFLVLAVALGVMSHSPDWSALVLLPVAVVVLVVLTAALAIAVSAINVYLRDTQHLLELALLAWFWGSAIVYNVELLRDRLGDLAWVVLLNPIIPIVTAFQRVLYNPPDDANILPDAPVSWYLRNLAFVGIGSVVLLFVALWIFGRLEDDFAEEI
jgi:ABC-2 type transport system permease protein